MNKYLIVETLNGNGTELEFANLKEAREKFEFLVYKYLTDSNNQLGFNFKNCKEWNIALYNGGYENEMTNGYVNLLDLRPKTTKLKELLKEKEELEEEYEDSGEVELLFDATKARNEALYIYDSLSEYEQHIYSLLK